MREHAGVGVLEAERPEAVVGHRQRDDERQPPRDPVHARRARAASPRAACRTPRARSAPGRGPGPRRASPNQTFIEIVEEKNSVKTSSCRGVVHVAVDAEGERDRPRRARRRAEAGPRPVGRRRELPPEVDGTGHGRRRQRAAARRYARPAVPDGSQRPAVVRRATTSGSPTRWTRSRRAGASSSGRERASRWAAR